MKFWVGDPCYHNGYDWDDYLDISNMGENPVTIEGRYVSGTYTEHGDGTYEGSNGMNYPVDSGTLGVVEWKDGDEPPFGMTLEEFNSIPNVDRVGTAVVISDGSRSIEIETSPDDLIDDEENYYDDEI